MKRIFGALVLLFSLQGCSQKKSEPSTTQTNIASEVVANLAAVSGDFRPDSLASTSSFVDSQGVTIQSDPCEGVTDFAVCQSNLIRAYLNIGKETVDLLAQIANVVGSALGNLDDGSTGTSQDGKISWNKTSATAFGILARGTGSNPVSYFSVSGSTYSLKFDATYAEDDPSPMTAEATVNFTDSNNWTVDVFFANTTCDSTDVGSPSKIHIKVAKANGLWTGKSMLYHPRWEAPGETVTCATTAGTHEITMYTDFVGNDTSTKAALYLIPASVSNLSSIGNYDLADFCTNFASYCGGAGEPTGGLLAAYPNNWCTTGPNTSPTWGDNCTSNATVSGASFSNASNWTTPSDLKIKTVTVPSSL